MDSLDWMDEATCRVSSTLDVMQPAPSTDTVTTPATQRHRAKLTRAPDQLW
jgi:hypothetical protein